MLDIKDLHAKISSEDKGVLNGVDLEIKPGTIHAIMGPNGSGKSTLSKVIAGHPDYEVSQGKVTFKQEDLLSKEPDERALAGLFMAFQYPVEIPGVNNEEFLRMAYNAKQSHLGKPLCDPFDFSALLNQKLLECGLQDSFLDRSVNHGFSGGEKKRNEILQLLLLDPDLIILDEIDSGLDIDALKVVANALSGFVKDTQKSVLMITHYQRLLNYITPDVVHVMLQGRIVTSGDAALALKLEEQGYDWLTR